MTPGGQARRAALCEALAELTEALCAEMRGGDSSHLEDLLGRRDALLDELRRLPPAAVARESAQERERAVQAVTRLLERDRELLGLIRARQAGLARTLEDLAGHRRSLGAYRGVAGTPPVYIDRLG